MNPRNELHTKRLLLRNLKTSDTPEVFALRSDPLVNTFISRTPAQNMEDATLHINKVMQEQERGACYYWAMSYKENFPLIGTICLWNFSEDDTLAEVGYELMPDHQGKGLMLEAMTAVLEFAFKTARLEAVEANVHHMNIASTGLLDSLGFRLNTGKVDSENSDNAIFKLTKTSWKCAHK